MRNFLNEAAILAAKGERVFLKQSDIRKAFVKVGIGPEKKEPGRFRKGTKDPQRIKKQGMRSCSMCCRM